MHLFLYVHLSIFFLNIIIGVNILMIRVNIDDDTPTQYVCEFDLKFADAMDNPTIADLAERVLKIGNTYLLDLLVVAIVCRMKGKLPTQIQEEWGIKNTYTEEEVNKMKKEAVWVEEPVWSTQRAV
eukprot:GHVR01067627.1.p1 GENE.GHVR01067627.1~~GHVR01067627.1.p1  ORF type:complete len:126 (+),score=28.71 GHVR01067627.1:313-690(+)